ncbi:disease resistance protein RPM1-like [Cornus florida]|uniref:disease resistance protein RPM1-like n=1 Tax=Cornus florida TaxID=4283 RepID=UPI00289AB962|nr:disease resistance protein RPM1-like [Cornus florida]
MREIILIKNEELLFAKDDSIFDDGQFRCLSIHNITNSVMNSITKSRIHSVITFGTDELPESFIGTLMTNFKLLKVLDFQNAPALNSLPEEVGNLLHLRYLSLRKTKVKVLPKSIGRLRYLLTLDLKESLVDELPIEINRLHKLRHLLASNRPYSQVVKIHEGFGCLKDLQKLNLVELANDHGKSLVKELIMLRQMRKLGIINLKKEEGKDMCIAVENMSHLQSLHVIATQNGILDLQHILSPPNSLQHLVLTGQLEKFPNWISKLQNLVTISLCDSSLTEDPLKSLQTLPNLLELVLNNAYDGKVLHFEEGGFQKLEQFQLYDMTKLISLKVDTGALPLLQAARIFKCWNLAEVSENIGNIVIF